MMIELPKEAIWLVSAVLIEAAVIDGLKLKVPNWLTLHFFVGGLVFATWWTMHLGQPWYAGLLLSLGGALVGLALLLPLWMIGGMGAGDVKLLAGVGAWVGPAATLGSFIGCALVGGILAIAMVIREGNVVRHWVMFQTIGHEILSLRQGLSNVSKISETAAERKPTMTLLPYGIPIAIGAIGYFLWAGMLVL